jgi:hypothetical protein
MARLSLSEDSLFFLRTDKSSYMAMKVLQFERSSRMNLRCPALFPINTTGKAMACQDPAENDKSSSPEVLGSAVSDSLNGLLSLSSQNWRGSWNLFDIPPELQDISAWKGGNKIMWDRGNRTREVSNSEEEFLEKGPIRNAIKKGDTNVRILGSARKTSVNEYGINSQDYSTTLDRSKSQWAQLHSYFVPHHLQPIKIMCGRAEGPSDFVAETPEDYALLRALTHSCARRRLSILIDNLACPRCVALLKSRKPKVVFFHPKYEGLAYYQKQTEIRKLWCSVKRHVKHVYHNDDCGYDSTCTHRNRQTSKVSQLVTLLLLSTKRIDTEGQAVRFFLGLGAENAQRMVNINLDKKESADIDVDVLESAIINLKHHFPVIESLGIQFHFGEAASRDPKLVARIVGCLKQMEMLLPVGVGARLAVNGFETHEACRKLGERSRGNGMSRIRSPLEQGILEDKEPVSTHGTQE